MDDNADDFGEFQSSDSTGIRNCSPAKEDSTVGPGAGVTHEDLDAPESTWFCSQDFVLASMYRDPEALDRLRLALETARGSLRPGPHDMPRKAADTPSKEELQQHLLAIASKFGKRSEIPQKSVGSEIQMHK